MIDRYDQSFLNMKFNLAEITDRFIVPFGFIVSGFIIGFIIEKIFLLNLKKMAIQRRWEGGSIIVNSFRHIAFFWFVIAGLYFALLNADDIGPRFFSHTRLILAVLLILSVTLLVSKLSTGFIRLYTGSVLPSTSIFTNITKIFVFVLGMLVLLQTIGISVAPVLTALGVGGLAVALALQDTLSNLFAGLHIIASKKIKPGDYIKLDNGNEGYLEDITWRNTAIKTLQKNIVIVPNNKMATGIITNYNIYPKDIELIIPVSIAHGSDLEKVENIAKEIALGSLKKLNVEYKEPLIRFNAITESGISFNAIIKVKEDTDQQILRHEYIKNIIQRFKSEDIHIPVPSQRVIIQTHNED